MWKEPEFNGPERQVQTCHSHTGFPGRKLLIGSELKSCTQWNHSFKNMCGPCTSVPDLLFLELGGKTRQTQSLLWMSTSQEKKRTILIVRDNGYKGTEHDLRSQGGLPRGPDVHAQGWNTSGNLCFYLPQIPSPFLPVIILQMHVIPMRAAKYTDPLATVASMDPRLE